MQLQQMFVPKRRPQLCLSYTLYPKMSCIFLIFLCSVSYRRCKAVCRLIIVSCLAQYSLHICFDIFYPTDPVNDIHEFSIQTDVKARHSEGVFVKTNVQGREVEDQESLQEQESRNVEQIVLVNEVEGHVPDISVQMLQQQAPGV